MLICSVGAVYFLEGCLILGNGFLRFRPHNEYQRIDLIGRKLLLEIRGQGASELYDGGIRTRRGKMP